jgi:ornithine--oxo-acid transaminase
MMMAPRDLGRLDGYLGWEAWAVWDGKSGHDDFVKWLEQHKGRAYDLHREHINPVFVKMLRTIGFDKGYVRGEGCYLWDAEGNKYLDLLTGWGCLRWGGTIRR